MNNNAEKSTVKGLVDNITYSNPDNGYCICSIDCEGTEVTLVGCIPGISEGEYMAAVESMAEAALADACTATNPRVPTKSEVMELYRRIW